MTNNNERPEWVEFEVFCNEVSLIKYKGRSPFDYFFFQKYEDDKGEFFMPALERYVDGKTIVTGNKNGYLSREKAISIMGKCLDVIASENTET